MSVRRNKAPYVDLDDAVIYDRGEYQRPSLTQCCRCGKTARIDYHGKLFCFDCYDEYEKTNVRKYFHPLTSSCDDFWVELLNDEESWVRIGRWNECFQKIGE